jgi:hypothetical protein
MLEKSEIQLLRRQEIDEEKWSRCIEDADNSRVYANHWYLDKVAENWEALIWGDYEFVMPLPVRKKWGLKYVFQPLFSQQLGIFPAPPLETGEKFMTKLADLFYYCETSLNPHNLVFEVLKNAQIQPRDNFLLPLGGGYSALSANFATNTKRNIAKAENNNLQLVTGMQTSEFIAFKKQNSGGRLTKEDSDNLRNLVSFLGYKGLGDVQGVYTSQNELCAVVFFLRWKNRLIYLSASSSEEGKNLGAMYFLVNQVIKEQAREPFIIDFEGSMIPGVARFYAGFGAFSETYFQIKLNRLPWPLKLFKK